MGANLPPSGPERRKMWHYTPELPLRLAPYWDWPVRPLLILKYLLRSWNPVAQRFLFLAFAFVTWAWFTPGLERVSAPGIG